MAENEDHSLTRWDPLADLGVFGRWPFRGAEFGRLADAARGRAGEMLPAVDISEDDDHYVVTAELPGTKKDDVTVEIHENVLTVRGHKRNEREEKSEQRRYVERSFGSFSRSFTLPANADGDHIKARFDDGVLTVSIQKSEEAKPRAVSIKG